MPSTTTTATGGAYTYTNTGLSSGTKYYYRVAAYAEGQQANSATSTRTTTAIIAFSGSSYTIDNTQPTAGTNFNSFTDAFTALNFGSIAGSTTINVVSGQTFNEDPSVLTATGTATKTVTIQKSGTNANPVIRPSGTAGTTDAGISLLGSDYFTFTGIDVKVIGTAVEYGYLVRNATATNGCYNNTFTDGTITLSTANSVAWGVCQVADGATANSVTPTSTSGCNWNNTYVRMQVYNAVAGIVAVGYSDTYYDYNTEMAFCTIGSSTGPIGGTTAFSAALNGGNNRKVSVHDNNVRNLSSSGTGSDIAAGVYFYNISGTSASDVSSITNNSIAGISGTSTGATATYVYGVMLQPVTAAAMPMNVTGNTVKNISNAGTASSNFAYGLYLYAPTTTGAVITTFSNNIVSNITAGYTSATTSSAILAGGIYLYLSGASNSSKVNTWFNTIVLNPASAPTYTNACFQTNSVTASVLDTRDNILANLTPAQSGVAKHYAWVSPTAGSVGPTGSVSDYNDLYTANTNGFVGLGGTTDYATLTNWQTANLTQDLNSVSIAPAFDATFKPTAATLKGLGVTISSVPNDIVGTARATGLAALQTGPCMGAYEFPNLPNVALVAGGLMAPAAVICDAGSATAPISLSVSNTLATDVNLNSNQRLVVTGTINLPGGGTQTLSKTVSSGTVPANGTLAVDLGTVNLTTQGTYTFSNLTVALQTADGTTIVESNTTDNTLSPNPTVRVSPLPTASLSNSGPVCAGNSATVSVALGGSAGPWTFGYTINGSARQSVIATTTNPYVITLPAPLTANQTVVITDLNDAGTGCAATAATLATAPYTTTVTINTSTTWTGTTSTDWFTSTNWSACVPTRYTDATVPGSVASGRYPNLTTTATAEVRTLTLASGSSLSESAGTLNIYGNLANNAAATLTLSGGMVSFLGATSTVANPVTFYNLTTNLSSASSTVTLSGNNTVSNSVTMTQGLLTASGTLTLAPAATITETDASYVTGKVATQHTLAAGTADAFGGMGLMLTPAAGSASPGSTSVVRTTGTTLTGVGTSQSIQRYFDINPATNTGLNVQMDFAFFNHENTNNISAANFQLFKSTAGTSGPWQRQPGTTTAATTGGYTVTKTGITDFSTWTIGDANNPLPVSLTRFEATRQNQNVALTWATASETDNAGFEVQVSLDGAAFRALGFVASPSPASLTARSYSLLDREPEKYGLRYYRLRQVDLSGKSSFSAVRTVAFEQGASLLAVPNPFAATLTVHMQAPAAVVAAPLTLTDALGRVVLRQLVDVPAGVSQLTLPELDRLPAGMYVLQLPLGGQVRTVKVVKQ